MLTERLEHCLKTAMAKKVQQMIHEEVNRVQIEKYIRAYIRKRVKKEVEKIIEEQIFNWFEEFDIEDENWKKNPKSIANIVLEILKNW